MSCLCNPATLLSHTPMSTLLTLTACIIGESTAFAIEIDQRKLVYMLKKQILLEKPHSLRSIDADQLSLWKAELPEDENLASAAQAVLSQELAKKNRPLGGTYAISKFFNSENVAQSEGIVHLLVQTPNQDYNLSNKRKQTPSSDVTTKDNLRMQIDQGEPKEKI